jgi:UDPglucose--hexose-1-phosphate uridylyltransferase
VVVLSPDHASGFGALDDDQAAEVLTILSERARVHAEAGRAHVQLLVNHGRAAGASIAHPHAQLLALDFVPPNVAVAAERFVSTGTDLVLDDHVAAIDAGTGVITGDEVAAWCSPGSASPFEVRIAALAGGANIEAATEGQILGTAIVLRDVLRAIGSALDDPPYNVIVHNGSAKPKGADAQVEETQVQASGPPFHWWLEVIPRVAVVAGFELGTGVLVNTVDPESAAARLRELLDP